MFILKKIKIAIKYFFLGKLNLSRNFKKKNKLRFTVHAADHCNLNCQNCDHFSPLASERYLDLHAYEQDCARLSKLEYDFGGNKIDEIRIAGGEPLLHPGIDEIIRITREYFIDCDIDIITNGILLLKMTQKFWDICAKCNTKIQVTKYPVSINYEQIKSLAMKNNVRLEFYGNSAIIKTSYHLPLDLDGKQNKKMMFAICSMANNCIQMEEGYIYTCSPPLTIKYFNKYFDENIQMTENDRINIYNVKTIDEILEFCRKPIPFCRYCDKLRMTSGIKWAVSKKNISEWI